uniref:Uncharacterized protein n=1 Tax=Acrobeloides nanus TaxID=290746 RepID=A0A914EKJ3_9BILA
MKSWFTKTKEEQKLEDQLNLLNSIVMDMENGKIGMKDMEKKIIENEAKITQNTIDLSSNAQFKDSFLKDFMMEMRNIAGRLANANGAPEPEQVRVQIV